MRDKSLAEQRRNLLDILGGSLMSSVWGGVDTDGHRIKDLDRNGLIFPFSSKKW